MRTFLMIALVASCGSPPAPRDPGPHNVAPAPAPAPGLGIDGLHPAKGDAEGGTYVMITGHRFIADGPRNAKIYFGAQQGLIVRFASDTELVVQAPGGPVGETVDVRLLLEPGGELELPHAFTYVTRPPAPDAVTP